MTVTSASLPPGFGANPPATSGRTTSERHVFGEGRQPAGHTLQRLREVVEFGQEGRHMPDVVECEPFDRAKLAGQARDRTSEQKVGEQHRRRRRQQREPGDDEIDPRGCCGRSRAAKAERGMAVSSRQSSNGSPAEET